jgi:hypothetical protein
VEGRLNFDGKTEGEGTQPNYQILQISKLKAGKARKVFE